MPATYENLATTTLTSNQTTVSFTNINQNYTDLILVINGANTASMNKKINFNGASTNQSCTVIYGNGSAAASARYTTTYLDVVGPDTNRYSCIVHIMNYANTTTNKTYLSRHDTAASATETIVGLWRSTAAITSIDIVSTNTNAMATGMTFTLYGIKAA